MKPLREAGPAAAASLSPAGTVEFATAARSTVERPASADYRFVAAWAAAWAVVGTGVGLGIAFVRGMADLAPILRQSVLFAEVVGFTSITSARLVFPLYQRLPVGVRFATQVLTLVSGTVFGSLAILATQPLYALARPKTVAMIVLVNAILGVIVGIAIHTYDGMRRQIEASYRILREKEAIERELAIAREVQRELLPPSAPALRGLELAAACVPAVGVGGDLYDFIPFADDRIGLVIADVSGKGIPAALLMAGLQASVRSLALPGVPPAELAYRLNDMLLRSTSVARYATFFYAHYDCRSRLLTYSNAGHYPPLHLSVDGVMRLSSGGMPIGLLEEARYGEGRRELGVGDLIALFTDGIVESPNAGDREFGEERLVDLLRTHRERPLDEIVRIVIGEVRNWTGDGPPHDDITLVLARAK